MTWIICSSVTIDNFNKFIQLPHSPPLRNHTHFTFHYFAAAAFVGFRGAGGATDGLTLSHPVSNIWL
jgi:hypothetical protein